MTTQPAPLECPHCGCAEGHERTGTTVGVRPPDAPRFAIWRCARCGKAWVAPQATEAEAEP